MFHTSLLSFSCYHFQTAFWMASACPAQNQAEVTTVYQLGTLLPTDCSLQRQYMHPFQSKETGYSIQKQHFPGPHRGVFGANAQVDTKGSVCTKEKATYVKILLAIDSISYIAVVWCLKLKKQVFG